MEKRFNKGLVLGKFMPVHNGHLHLIDTAIEQCEIVYVMICSIKSEPIDGKLRYYWLKEIYKGYNNVEIIHCEDENPQKPEECSSVDDFYNDYWLPSVYNRINSLNAVFTSEEYGDEFAEYLQVDHVLVDLERKKYPVSGTLVRNNAFDMWDYIPDIVKQYYVKRIAIIGPESTGKSTLTKNLSEYFNSDFIEEYGREYTEIHGTSNLRKKDFQKISVKQYLNAFSFRSNPTKLLFCDTEALTTKIFAEMYIGKKNIPLLEYFINKQKFDLWLLLDIDIPWVDDGTRDFPNERKNHLNKLIEELNNRKINYVLISGNFEDRLKTTIKEINKLL